MTEQTGEKAFVDPQPVSMGLSEIDPDNHHSIRLDML